MLYEVDNFLIEHKPYFPVGRLETQFKALRRINEADVILSLKETESSFLHYLRALGFLKIPVVTLVHHSQDIGRFNKLEKPDLQIDQSRLGCHPDFFSERVRILSGEDKIKVVRWGPDLAYYDRLNPSFGNKIMTAGRSGRDFGTFAKACIESKAYAKVMCLDYDKSPVFDTRIPMLTMRLDCNLSMRFVLNLRTR